MYYVYILKSQKYKNKFYVGYSEDLKARVISHNRGENNYTKYGLPWKLIYYEAFLDKTDAMARERQLKTGSSAIGFLKRRIKNSLNSN